MMKQKIEKLLMFMYVMVLVIGVCNIEIKRVQGDMDDNIEKGTYGENITYMLDSEGILTMSGSGIMSNTYEEYDGEDENYGNYYSSIFGNKVKKLIIDEGVRTICGHAFDECSMLETVELPNSLVYVRTSAFEDCIALREIVFPQNVLEIRENVLKGCDSLEVIVVLNSYCEIKAEGNIESVKKIKGYDDSTAEKFAKENGIEFESLGKNPNVRPDYAWGDICYFSADVYERADKDYNYGIALVFKSVSEEKESGYRKVYQVQVANNPQFLTDDKEMLGEGELELYMDENVCLGNKYSGNFVIRHEKLKETGIYYARVRLCKYNSNETIYGNWSNVNQINLLGNNTEETTSYLNNNDTKLPTSQIQAVTDRSKEKTKKQLSRPKKVTGVKIKKAKKSLKVTWTKVKNVTGYQIQYSTSSKFKKAKTVTIKKAKTTSKNIKKLKTKKKYYVRIRTYIAVNGKKKYSNWSKAKSQKTK